MIKFKLLTFSFLLILLFGNFVYSQQSVKDSTKTIGKIETYLDKIEKVGFSGSILVELNGKKVISRGYGFGDINQKLKNTPDTIFDIGSITKQFTAAAILKLEMQGKLSTADKISKYFADVPKDKAEITLHDLLRHQTGLPSVVGGDYDQITEREFIEKVLNAPLRFENGTAFSYSNVGYSLLAIIIEKVSGMSYENYLYNNLWKPSGMESTGYTRPNYDQNLIAIGYKEEQEWGKPTDKKWDIDSPFWHLKGNGGILSTTEDLYKWHTALLSDKILSNEAKQKYFSPPIRSNETSDSYYAFGWDVHQTSRKTTVIQHNGANGIFYADFQRYVDENVTVIMLLNNTQPQLYKTSSVIANIIFNPSYKPTIPIADNQVNRSFTKELIDITLEKGFDEGIKTYKKRKRDLDIVESLVNDKGYDLLADKKLQNSIDIFKLNVFAFPKSANAFDSLGEAYLEAGNKPLAIANYEKSLKLDPENKNAEVILKRLKNE